MTVLGIDTSNYTTSVAAFRQDGTGMNAGRLLEVKKGELGLRQSDALFDHVRHLPEQFMRLEQAGFLEGIQAVGASTRPRAVEGSYMPCFLAGASQGQAVALTLGVPFYAFSHQQGHLAAAAWSAGRMDLLDRPHLAWHLSGGTTELLLVEPVGYSVGVRCIGGTTDISAGQLIDRTGKYLGLSFPAGKALDELSHRAVTDTWFQVKIKGLEFSLSGVENKVKELCARRADPEEIARFALHTVASAVVRTTKLALQQYPDYPVLCSGGVASNALLRQHMAGCKAIFAAPEYSTDNAMGIAILTARAMGWRD